MPDMKKPLNDGKALAGKSSIRGSGNAVKHGERIAAAGACKQRSREMAIHLGENGTTEQHRKLHAEISGCANYLVFHNYYTKDEIRLAKARTCKKHLLCPFCARARGAKLMEKNIPKVAQALEDNPNLVAALLTLTVANQEELKAATEHLHKSFRTALKRRRDWKEKKRGWTEFAKIEGAIYATEVTHSEENGWHPHIHAVVLLNSYIDREALSAEWERITGDSKIIDIRKLKTDENGEVTDSLAEVFKYAVKFADLPLDKNLEAYDALHGKRLIGSFGCLHGLKLPEKLTDELYDDLPYIEMFYKYVAQKAAFELTDATPKKPMNEQLDDLEKQHEQANQFQTQSTDVSGQLSAGREHTDAEDAYGQRRFRSSGSLRCDQQGQSGNDDDGQGQRDDSPPVPIGSDNALD